MITSPPPAARHPPPPPPLQTPRTQIAAAVCGRRRWVFLRKSERQSIIARAEPTSPLRIHHYCEHVTYIHAYNLYICEYNIIYATSRANRHPRQLRPADYSRATPSLALSPANGRCTTVATIPLGTIICTVYLDDGGRSPPVRLSVRQLASG